MDRPLKRASPDEAAAVRATRSRWAFWAMTIYMRRYARRHFHAIRIAAGSLPLVDAGRSVIVYTNHPSWWDPVMFVLLHARVFPRRAAYGPMEAQALERYGVLKRIGIFGLESGTRRGAVRFLRVSSGILRAADTVLWVTAEGSFTDPRQRPVQLRPGVAHLLHMHPNTVAIPLALEFPFWNESKPETLVRFGTPILGMPGRSVAEWDKILTTQLTQTMDRLAEDSISRDPGRFRSMVAGRAGIGGIYDLWRRVRAALHGEHWWPEHDQPDHSHAGRPAP